MYSSQPADHAPPGAFRRWLAGRSLRARLVSVVVALLAVVCVLTSAATTIALDHFLTRQLDEQLSVVAARANGRPGPPPEPLPPLDPPLDPFPRGQPAGTLAARVVDGQVERADIFRPDSAAEQTAVPQDRWSELASVPADAEPYTRDLGELGDYRLVARPMPDGAVLVTGLPLTGSQQTVWDMVGVQFTVGLAGLLLAGTAGTLIVRAALRPLRRVAATARHVAGLPLDRGEVALSVRVPVTETDERTEVGQVGLALNRMLGHVGAALAARQASESRVRRFVADASHELRTPLAAIRGYAELARRAREPVPPDIAHAMRRVEAESTRMTSLVDDLLLLARLDSGRPLAREPVDLSALTVDAVSDAHVAGPEHRWRLDVPDQPLQVVGDPARLQQILVNLLTNARTHTPPGTTIRTTLRLSGRDEVELTVLDDGPGIPAESQGEVFERFVRGDSSRSRAAGGTGLGLAIVAAVVEAHHGTVTLTSRPGRTSFSVRLPRLTAQT